METPEEIEARRAAQHDEHLSTALAVEIAAIRRELHAQGVQLANFHGASLRHDALLLQHAAALSESQVWGTTLSEAVEALKISIDTLRDALRDSEERNTTAHQRIVETLSELASGNVSLHGRVVEAQGDAQVARAQIPRMVRASYWVAGAIASFAASAIGVVLAGIFSPHVGRALAAGWQALWAMP